MTRSFIDRSTCRLCNGTLRTVLTLPDTPLANAYPTRRSEPQEHYPLRIDQCTTCAHVQCPIVVNPDMLFTDYSYTSSTAGSMKRHIAQLAGEISTPGGFLVDIGSNDGLLLSEAQRCGMRALGIDPARNLAAEATKAGRFTLPSYITPSMAVQLRNIIGHPCTVTALNVFAHSDNLSDILKSVYELIKPSGNFIFEVAYLLDILEKNEIGTLYHEHLSHHHVEPLVQFLRQHGLGLYRVDRVESQGGSIRCYVRVNGVPGPSVPAAIKKERELIPGLLKDWPARVRREQVELWRMLEPYRGKGLAIYGAPARLTPYIYAMGFRRDDVVCVFDDEPRKIGKFTPGLRWPIVSSSELLARNPTAVLISAWPYAREIQAKFPQYKGRWLVPPRAN